jgi:CheY-like chemotaxis protein
MKTTLFTIGREAETLFPSAISLPAIPNLNDIPETDKRDIAIHNWLVESWLDSKISDAVNPALVLPANDINFRIGAHIRLSYFDNKEQACLPIVYVYPDSEGKSIMENWHTRFGSLSSIIGTKGVYLYAHHDLISYLNKPESDDDLFTSHSTSHILIEPLPCHDTSFKLDFLNKINLPPNDVIGHHALGNIWGAYVLDRVLKTNALHQNETFMRERCKLYFKLMAARHRASNQGTADELNELPKISLGQRKIAIIDDEAHKGFADVIKAYFGNPPADQLFIIKEKVDGYDALSDKAKKIIEEGEIHLLLLDLRLNGSDEEEQGNTGNYSGAKVLQKIKSMNKANQVIMFTASNKAWNMRALFDMGADGYYIKESAEGGFNWKESRSNALKLLFGIQACFSKDYLWNRIQCHKDIEEIIAAEPFGHEEESFYENTLSNLEAAFNLLRISRNNDQYMNYAYLSYYRIIEEFVGASRFFSKNNNRFYVTKRDGSQHEVYNIDTEQSELTYKGTSQFRFRETHLYCPYFTVARSKDCQKPQTLAKVSYLLAFRYEKGNSELQKWGELNAIRNQIVAHPSKKTGHLFVEKEEIERISDFLLKLLE